MISCSFPVNGMLVNRVIVFLPYSSTEIEHLIHRGNLCNLSGNKEFNTYHHFHVVYYYKGSNIDKPF